MKTHLPRALLGFPINSIYKMRIRAGMFWSSTRLKQASRCCGLHGGDAPERVGRQIAGVVPTLHHDGHGCAAGDPSTAG
jgi:hypothetical protein